MSDECEEDLRLVTFCGLYCGLCAERGRIAQQALGLRDSMAKEGYELWGNDLPDFAPFWRFLTRLADPDKACPGCRQGGGPPFCGIRKCALRRGVRICAECEDYPCKGLLGLAKGYPTLLADGQRMREVGLAQWIAEQEARADAGFAYVDIRYHPYEIPEE